MKKLFILVAVCGLAATSCKKERSCVCDDNVKIPAGKAKKSDQEKICESASLIYGNCKLD